MKTENFNSTLTLSQNLAQLDLLLQPYLWLMDKVSDGPFEHSGGGLHTSSKDVSNSHEEVVFTEAHRLCTDLCRVVVLGAALGSQQSIQQVPLHMVTVIFLQAGGG